MNDKYEPCSICEEYIEGVICNKDKCPVGRMKKEIKTAKAKAIKELMFNLENEISTYSSAGKDLNVYAWLKYYAKEMVGEE